MGTRRRFPRRFRAPTVAALFLVALALGVAGGAWLATTGSQDAVVRPQPGQKLVPAAPAEAVEEEEVFDPLAWDPEREEEYVQRAREGFAHPLYTLSPGGAARSAQRTARWRPQIEAAAAQAGVPADTLEGMVLLESAGRSNAVAGDGSDLSVAVGLTQILAETGQNLLDMRIDVERSEKLSGRIERAFARNRTRRGRELRRERARIDERFDPAKALAATARYLRFARGELGRTDLAVVSYHMGVGNLRNVLDLYGEDAVSYAQLYFEATPRTHPETYAELLGLGDFSSTYLWRVGAAQDIMALWRADPQELERLQTLHDEKNSSEEVLRPESETEVFADSEDLEDAYASGDLLALDRDRLRAGGLRVDGDMGELARELDRSRRLYRGLRPEALAVLVYLGTGARQISGDDPLVVTSTARDRDYQQALLEDGNGEATRDYSLHTTGFAFDLERRYVSDRQSQALQFMLDRLQSLDVIAWVREPAAIHVTVGPRGRELLGVLGG